MKFKKSFPVSTKSKKKTVYWPGNDLWTLKMTTLALKLFLSFNFTWLLLSCWLMCVISRIQLGVLCIIVHTFVPSSCRPTHTMNITLDKVGHIITDHEQHILYVHSSCHGIWADKKLNFAWSEISEDCLTLLWCQTRGVFGNFYSTIELNKKIQSVENKKISLLVCGPKQTV